MSDSNKKFILVEHRIELIGKGDLTIYHPPFLSGKFYKRIHRAYLYDEDVAEMLRNFLEELGDLFGDLLGRVLKIIFLGIAYLIYYIVWSIIVMPLGIVRFLMGFYWKRRGFTFEQPGKKADV